jgi:hypothetical protein
MAGGSDVFVDEYLIQINTRDYNQNFRPCVCQCFYMSSCLHTHFNTVEKKAKETSIYLLLFIKYFWQVNCRQWKRKQGN